MKKRILVIIIAILAFIPFVSAKDKKVKVYMFEAGGCPYCEAQEEYLKGLDGYDKKFELIKKELYVDHVEWKEGKDYELGVKVATSFQEAGFENASYEGTPFVVISDLYATAGYSESLEDIINEAYEKGDKDIVGCYADGKNDCLNHIKKQVKTKINYDNLFTIGTIILCSGIIILIYLIKSNKDKKAIIKLLEMKSVEKNVKEESIKNTKKDLKISKSKQTKNKVSTKKSNNK